MQRLPLNCIVDYLTGFLSAAEASELYQTLIDDYQIDEARLTIEAGGRTIETDSFKILFSTKELMAQNTHPEHIHGAVYPWNGAMARLRKKIETLVGRKFEIAMCLYYPDGNYFAPYHSDQQTSGTTTILPSISLGEVREFVFRENESGEIFSLDLDHGSLLMMGDFCQNRYEHSLLKDSRYQQGRIKITFREASYQ